MSMLTIHARQSSKFMNSLVGRCVSSRGFPIICGGPPYMGVLTWGSPIYECPPINRGPPHMEVPHKWETPMASPIYEGPPHVGQFNVDVDDRFKAIFQVHEHTYLCTHTTTTTTTTTTTSSKQPDFFSLQAPRPGKMRGKVAWASLVCEHSLAYRHTYVHTDIHTCECTYIHASVDTSADGMHTHIHT